MSNSTVRHAPETASDPAAALLQGLKRSGLRLTRQRRAICQALAASRSHPTAQSLYDEVRTQHPSLSRATVYNTLEVLAKAGLVDELGTAGDGAVHYDADLAPHVNLMCMNCHRVEDFPAARLGGVAREVSAGSGYELRGARVVYYGLCPACKRRAQKSKAV
jgi:Fur family peroxide stress response transcriptional regulator